MEASYGYQPMSLDSSSNDDSEDKDITLIDKIGKEEGNFGSIEYEDFINKFIETLNELEVKIFKDRFFFDKTQSSIAKELGISQMTVSRLEKKVVEKLKKNMKKIYKKYKKVLTYCFKDGIVLLVLEKGTRNKHEH